MELSKEEQEAIEKLKQMEKFYNEFSNSGVEISMTLNEKDIEIIIKILNLISKLQKENENLNNQANELVDDYEGQLQEKNNYIFNLETENEKQEKRIDELENHIHYKNCLACGKEFRAKRNDAKYCVYCSKFMNNRNYYMNLTEEQKAKRREQSKLSMRKLRSK